MARLSKRDRYLVAKLGEEGAELAAACAKLLAKPTSKRVGRMKEEASDVTGVMRLLKYLEDPVMHRMSLDRTAKERARAPKMFK